MSERKQLFVLAGVVLAVSLLAASVTAVLQAAYYQHMHFQKLGEICGEIMETRPDAAQAVLSILKENSFGGRRPKVQPDENVILAYGYRQSDFLKSARSGSLIFAGIGFSLSGTLFLFLLFYWRKRETMRIQALTDFLEKVNAGGSGLLFHAGEDAYSKLQDEIYKTVTMLYQTRDAALKARENFAENLSNIAHQIKTPITSISLAVQMLKQETAPEYSCHLQQIRHDKRQSCHQNLPEHSHHLQQIRQQISRLAHLEEALLLLSRMDAGALSLERKETDVFTILMLAADNLEEICAKAGVSVYIPESGEIGIHADLDWTMEAVMNLIKNCVEHTPSGGMVYCDYEQNPLYTQIRIWDTGNGFAKEDIPHLFERFYRGQNAKSGGIGIGLALSKEIIERQNGTLYARNLPEGGACFEIRFYTAFKIK